MGGGAESLLTSIVNNLNPEKYVISIFELLHSDIKKETTREEVRILPYLMRADDPKRKEKMYYVYHRPEEVFRQSIKDEYDIYIAFNAQRPSFLLPVGKKNIAWIHSDLYMYGAIDKKEELDLQRDAFKKTTKIVSISDITTESIIDLFPESRDKIVEIYNGIDVDKVRELSQYETNIYLKKPAVLFIGRFEERKDPVRLVSVLKLIHLQSVKAHAYFMGYGDLKTEIISAASEKGIDSFVHIIDYQDNPFPIICQCDVVTLLSKTEGFPMCLLEGMTLGKPFVSTLVGGSRLINANGRCGRIITTDEEAAEAIIGFIEGDKEAQENSCQETVKQYSLQGYIKKVEQLLDTL